MMNTVEAAEILRLSPEKAKKDFRSAKSKMLLERNKRRVPRDGKLLAAWNGLTLTAYAKAAKHFKDKRYSQAAEEVKDYIHNNLWIENKMVRAVKGKKILGEAGLEDYAYVAEGLSHWLDYSHNKKDQKWLENIIGQAWNRFYKKQGWLLSENSLLKYGEGQKVVSDGVLPSASSILISISLNNIMNNMSLKKKIVHVLNIGHRELEEQPFWYASQINALYDYQKRYE